MYLGKLTVALNTRIVELANKENVKTDTIIKLINDYMRSICSKNTQESVMNRINSFSTQTSFRNAVKENNFKIYTVVEPFHDVSFESIKSAAELLDVQLDEKITITTPDGKKITTDKPVPVGVTLMQFLEHFSATYVSVGGAQKYSGLSKQPVKVGSGQNVSSLGQMDINALITYGVDNILHELLTARSDHHKLKRKLYSDIFESGDLSSLSSIGSVGGTAEIKNTYFITLGLDVK